MHESLRKGSQKWAVQNRANVGLLSLLFGQIPANSCALRAKNGSAVFRLMLMFTCGPSLALRSRQIKSE
jgi:hypothetical protein